MVSAMRPASLNAGITMETVGVPASTGASRPAPIEVSDASINRRIVSSVICMNDRLLRVCRHERVDRAPVWMMRQAGRYLPEYREIRRKLSFLELCKDTDVAVEVSLQPYRILGVDAVIFFSDILIPVEAIGVHVSLTEKGPEIAKPVRTQSDVDDLRIPDPATEVPFVGAIIKKLNRELRAHLGRSRRTWSKVEAPEISPRSK